MTQDKPIPYKTNDALPISYESKVQIVTRLSSISEGLPGGTNLGTFEFWG